MSIILQQKPLNYLMASKAVQTSNPTYHKLESSHNLRVFKIVLLAAYFSSIFFLQSISLRSLPNFLSRCSPTAALSSPHRNDPYHRFLLAPMPITISQTIDPLSIANYHIANKHHHNTNADSFKHSTLLITTEPLSLIF